MRRLVFATLVILRLLRAESVTAQSIADTPPADQLQGAAAAFNASHWTDANTRYAAIAKRYPQSALAEFRVGVTLTEMGRAREALPHLRRGEQLGAPPGNAAYRLAQAFAELAMGDSAIAELRRAAAAGFSMLPSGLEGDGHLAKISTHKEWHTLLDEYDALVHPCLHDVRFREFDFWVGDWDVTQNGGPPSPTPSRNRITLEEDGCIVQEHWTGAGGSTGQSFNIFDRSVGQWRQTWVDNGGGQHDYAGSLVNGNMVLEGTTPNPNGGLGRVPTKLTLFHISKDTVRQFSQSTADSGKTWTTNYDLIYVRRAPASP